MYAGKRTLVTGGTGSFGQTMVRRMLAAEVAEVRVLSRDVGKHDQMRVELADPRVRFYVGDVRDYLSVERACRDVDMVFHAAALKQKCVAAGVPVIVEKPIGDTVEAATRLGPRRRTPSPTATTAGRRPSRAGVPGPS